jgi:hypothetical protein
LIGTAGVVLLAAAGPAAAMQLDRFASLQHFDCGQGPVTLVIEVFSPRSTAAEQRRLLGDMSREDVETHPVPDRAGAALAPVSVRRAKQGPGLTRPSNPGRDCFAPLAMTLGQ